MNNFDINDRLYVSGTTVEAIDGKAGVVLALPGYDPRWPDAYALKFEDGTIRPVHYSYLKWIKSPKPTNRGDLDIASNWNAFDKATKLDSSKWRNA